MPYILSRHREEYNEIKVPGTFYDRKISNWLASTYFAEDGVTGQKYIREGMIVAKHPDWLDGKYVPYSEAASYGDSSDVAVGVLDERMILTFGDEATAPLYHGQLIEKHCYVYGGTVGVIPTAAKATIPDIDWV